MNLTSIRIVLTRLQAFALCLHASATVFSSCWSTLGLLLTHAIMMRVMCDSHMQTLGSQTDFSTTAM